ncbi:YggT family protein [Corynebacterium kefirresidentii]|uniref:YggT family protein n=1 Tax=Corynebacterium kefirresidentii TaxID=1979527 RepID=A0ABT8Q1D5_9CORY|nr:YggT family protein [Corynebacterium kefirresidentii]MCG7449207.1 YggT family protein [Corynebacterium kefirresidentii]MCG7451269.1 YggT family protein [Corynebacterium kefirresidentii]MDN8619019.1 YggT family protein [Corynebacterium kefirresidentii]MDN8632864.1 YggT family protein [Corynebacterium kefirresidentii]MDN8641333.1 YggT family protein [Corynebacterium kefirresidentii]
MTQLGIILILLVQIYTWVLIARIIIEMIQSFSRQFNPPRWFMVVAEPLFVITDPPVKALRRLIPPLQMGGVALDVSVLVLFILLSILTRILQIVFFG